MKHVPQDGIGSEDDLPPSDQERRGRERIRGTGSTSGAARHPSEQKHMETQIHEFGQEAYQAVVLAFKAQSDSITWEKAELMTALREELGVSSQQDREVQDRANDAEIIHRIRELRQAGGGVRSGLIDDARPLHHIRLEDIQWEDEDPGISQVGRSGPDHQKEKPMEHLATIPGLGRGRGSPKAQPDFPPSHNDIVKKNSDEIEILDTGSQLQEVERAVDAPHPTILKWRSQRNY